MHSWSAKMIGSWERVTSLMAFFAQGGNLQITSLLKKTPSCWNWEDLLVKVGRFLQPTRILLVQHSIIARDLLENYHTYTCNSREKTRKLSSLRAVHSRWHCLTICCRHSIGIRETNASTDIHWCPLQYGQQVCQKVLHVWIFPPYFCPRPRHPSAICR